MNIFKDNKCVSLNKLLSVEILKACWTCPPLRCIKKHIVSLSLLPLAPPKVQIYSRDPGEYGTGNTLICHVSNFHPPDIEIKLFKDGVEIPGAKQTDLAFRKDWRFHLTKNVAFKPQKGEEYTCKVTHGGRESTYSWGEFVCLCRANVNFSQYKNK